RSRHLERPAAVEVEQRLHETLAERGVANDDGSIMVLQRARDDLRSGRRVLIRQNDERNIRSRRLFTRVVHLRLGVSSADARDLLALLEEEIADRERLIEEATGVVPEIEDDPSSTHILQTSNAFGEFGGGVLVELIERDVAHLTVEGDLVRHR